MSEDDGLVRIDQRANITPGGLAAIKRSLRMVEQERDALKAYADELAAGLPEGMLPKDIENIRRANEQFAAELAEYRQQEANRIQMMKALQLDDGVEEAVLGRLVSYAEMVAERDSSRNANVKLIEALAASKAENEKLVAERNELKLENEGWALHVVPDMNYDIQECRKENSRLREAQRWIPVGERQPEHEMNALVVCDASDPFIAFFDKAEWWDGKYPANVTAWMDLPAGPIVDNPAG